MSVLVDRATLEALDALHGGEGLGWMASVLAGDPFRARGQTSPVRIEGGVADVILDITGPRTCRHWQGDIGSGWRWNGERLWTEDALEGMPEQILSALVGRTVADLVDFAPLAARPIVGIMGGSLPCGVILAPDRVAVDLDIPGDPNP